MSPYLQLKTRRYIDTEIETDTDEKLILYVHTIAHRGYDINYKDCIDRHKLGHLYRGGGVLGETKRGRKCPLYQH